MDKILIDLFVPALSEKYELFIAAKSPLGEILPLIVDGICTMSSLAYIPSGEELLCRKDRALTELSLTAEQLGIRNGDYLMLI